ncbi:MAG: ribosome-associated heat shock protein Hsp15 [Arenicella sp.]|jgi:ribosome-associated heat shock protein Hsp15
MPTRIDKWLWAARFYKTRQLAIKAVKNSQVGLNGQNVKPAATVKIGDTVNLKKGLYKLEILVDSINDKRGSATVAQTMYHETDQSIAGRESLKKQLANQPKIDIDQRKPDRRGVRSHRQLKRGD